MLGITVVVLAGAFAPSLSETFFRVTTYASLIRLVSLSILGDLLLRALLTYFQATEAFFRFIDRHRSMYRIVRQAEFVDPALFRWYYRHFAEGYISGLRDAQRLGQVRAVDPEVLAFCLMGIGDFVGMRWVLWERRGPSREVVDGMMAFILQGLAADGVRPAAGREAPR